MTSKGNLHILGIAGTFMANLAVLAKQLGYNVTGSDLNVYPPMSDLLTSENIEYSKDYSLNSNKKYLDKADCIVIGNALSRGNPCVEYILENKLIFASGPDWLARNILQDKWVLAVSGTHGKTTTSSMLAWILEYNNLNPGYLIGGRANNFPQATRITDSKYFVIEADEYDTAFFDKRPKFLHYLPNTLIINNIEYDHADIYPNIEAIEQQFGYLLRTVPHHNGLVVAPDLLQDKLTQNSVITKNFGVANKQVDLRINAKYFAITDSRNHISDNIYENKLVALLTNQDGSQFECYLNGKLLGKIKWNCLGIHNVNNALASMLAANSVGVSIPEAINALSSFKGVARRLEQKAVLDNGIIIFDDFAHHPTAIKTTLGGLRKHYNNHHLTVIVDFSSFSMRSGIYTDEEMVNALEFSDKVYIYQAEYVKFDCGKLLKKISEVKPCYAFTNSNQLINDLANKITDNEIIVFMTKSDFNKKIDELITLLSPVMQSNKL